MSNPLDHLLVMISSWLLIPDMLLLLGFALFATANLGGLFSEALSRFRSRPAFSNLVKTVRRKGIRFDPEDVNVRFGLPAMAFAELRYSAHAPTKILDDLQLSADKAVGRLHMGIRLGPMLGLAGTLIPLGPALRSLAAGDTQALANGLIVAFATPVVGMLIGGLCFFMHAVRQRWYTQDLNDLEFLFSHLSRHTPDESEESCESSVA